MIDNDEVMSIDNERFYLTAELESRYLKKFIEKLQDDFKLNIKLLDINEKEKEKEQ